MVPLWHDRGRSHRHLKDHLFHGLKPNLHNALHYLYVKPDSQYSQLVMASRKAETETLGSGVSDSRAKFTIAGTNTDLAKSKASSEPSYKAITQKIAYLMSAVAKQVTSEPIKPSGCLGSKPNETNKYSLIHFKDPNVIERTCLAGDVGGLDIAGENVPLPVKGIPFLSGPTSQVQTQ